MKITGLYRVGDKIETQVTAIAFRNATVSNIAQLLLRLKREDGANFLAVTNGG